MIEVNLLRSLPQSNRSIAARASAKTDEHIRISRQYGQEYFDGSREYGYGGYSYDGRWVPVATDIIDHFGLETGERVLDVGCAKGFLVKDLVDSGIDAFGIDVSEYALLNCVPDVVGRLHLGNATKLVFPDCSFGVVLAINSLHNLPREDCLTALKEIERLAPGRGFVQVDSYRTLQEKRVFEDWVLTAMFHGFPEEWLELFDEAGYTGDWNWTFIG
jgi:ubiquinone/menaquinone biosynthesis C-methylase UbiE